ncbi:MAG TPA: hypothetical protein VMT19_06260 [Thermoanaerobaculaceae bacterium]|nr:hypothetical protein [Thermoanaerobaculaceae bacterium]
MVATLLLAATVAAPWEPIQVHYDVRGSAWTETLAISTFSWTYQADQWQVVLPARADAAAACVDVVGPGKVTSAVCDGLALDHPNPLMATEPGKWDQSYVTGFARVAHHLLEVWENQQWRVFRLLWPIGGASGPPPVPLVTIAQDRRCGAWMALATSLEPRVPDGGDTHGLEVGDDGNLVAWSWWWHTGSVLARRSWSISASSGTIVWRRLPTTYMLQTYNGVPATYARDPRDAVHWGYQEVAWHVRKAETHGGVAETFADSPRRVTGEGDTADGLLIPMHGHSIAFAWSSRVYVIPYHLKGHWLLASEASRLATAGTYDAVLFRSSSGRVVAERLVQHQRDFAHSTPPR